MRHTLFLFVDINSFNKLSTFEIIKWDTYIPMCNFGIKAFFKLDTIHTFSPILNCVEKYTPIYQPKKNVRAWNSIKLRRFTMAGIYSIYTKCLEYHEELRPTFTVQKMISVSMSPWNYPGLIHMIRSTYIHFKCGWRLL